MPCDFEIDVARRLVRSRLSGEITGEELQEHQRLLAEDPRFGPDYSQLIDSRDVTSFSQVKGAAIMASSRRHLFGRQSRRAIVAIIPAAVGLARMFETYRELSGGEEQIRIFDTLEDALSWLSDAR